VLRDRGQKPAPNLLDPRLVGGDFGVSSLQKTALLTADLFGLGARGGWPGVFRGADARKRRARSDERQKQRCNEPERTHFLPSRREPYDRGARLASGHLLEARTVQAVLGHASLSTTAIFAHV
jgi:hypothetical protein